MLTEKQLTQIKKHLYSAAEVRLTDGKKLLDHIEQQQYIIKGLQMVVDLAIEERGVEV